MYFYKHKYVLKSLTLDYNYNYKITKELLPDVFKMLTLCVKDSMYKDKNVQIPYS